MWWRTAVGEQKEAAGSAAPSPFSSLLLLVEEVSGRTRDGADATEEYIRADIVEITAVLTYQYV
jgi:hypothetical protein